MDDLRGCNLLNVRLITCCMIDSDDDNPNMYTIMNITYSQDELETFLKDDKYECYQTVFTMYNYYIYNGKLLTFFYLTWKWNVINVIEGIA